MVKENRQLFAVVLIGLVLGLHVGGAVRADEAVHKCRPAAEWRAEIQKDGGKIEALHGSQFEFLRGVSAMHPNTPSGLPYGEAAQLATLPTGPAVVVFLDELDVCDPIPLPPELVEMLKAVGEGRMLHQGGT